MKKVCEPGKFATKLESNTIYLGKSNDKYDCPGGQCAELGSFFRPCKSIKKAFEVLSKRYDNSTPVVLSFAAGEYVYDEEAPADAPNTEVQIPSNNFAWSVPNGKIFVKGMDILIKDSSFDMENVFLIGNLSISDGEAPTTGFPTFTAKQSNFLFNFKATYQGPGFRNIVCADSILGNGGFTSTLSMIGNIISVIQGSTLNNVAIEYGTKGEEKANHVLKEVNAIKVSMKSTATDKSQLTSIIKGSNLSQGEQENPGSMFTHFVSHSATLSEIRDSSTIVANTANPMNNIEAADDAKASVLERNSTSRQIGSGGIQVLTGRANAKLELLFKDTSHRIDNASNDNGEQYWKKHHLSHQAQLKISATDTFVEAQSYKSLTEINDKANKSASKVGSRTISKGKKNFLNNNSEHKSQSINCDRISGDNGYRSEIIANGQSKLKESRQGGVNELSPEKSASTIFSWKLFDEASYAGEHDAVSHSFVNNNVNTPESKQVTSGVWAEEITQSGKSSVSINRRNCRDKLIALGYRRKILKDSSKHVHTERGQELEADDLSDDQVVYGVDAADDVDSSFTGDANTSKVVGGIFEEEFRRGRSKHISIVTGQRLTHTPKTLLQEVRTFISELDDDATEQVIETNNIRKSYGVLKTKRLKKRTRAACTSTNSLEEAVTLHDQRADDDSRIDIRNDVVEHVGDKTSKGNVYQIMNQSIGIGKFNHETGKDGQKQGQVSFTGGSHTGPLKIKEAFKLISNYNKFSGGNEPALDLEDTDQDHNLSSFDSDIDGPVIRSRNNKNKVPVRIDMAAARISSLFPGKNQNFLVQLLGEKHESFNVGTTSFSKDLVAEYIGDEPDSKANSNSHFTLNVRSKTPGILKNFNLQKLSSDLQEG